MRKQIETQALGRDAEAPHRALYILALPCLSALAGRVAQRFQQDAAVLRTALHAQYQVEGGYVLLSSTTVARRETDDMGAP